MGLSDVAAEAEGSFFFTSRHRKGNKSNFAAPTPSGAATLCCLRRPDVRQTDRAAGFRFPICLTFGLSTMVWRFGFADSDKGGRDLYAAHQLLPMLLILQLKTVWHLQDAAFFQEVTSNNF